MTLKSNYLWHKIGTPFCIGTHANLIYVSRIEGDRVYTKSRETLSEGKILYLSLYRFRSVCHVTRERMALFDMALIRMPNDNKTPLQQRVINKLKNCRWLSCGLFVQVSEMIRRQLSHSRH